MVSKKEMRVKEWKTMAVEIEFPSEVSVKYEERSLVVKGPKGEVSKKLSYPNVKISVDLGKVIISTEKFSQMEKKIIHTYRAHVKNLIKGVMEGFVYNLAIVYAKFPMTVEFKDGRFIVKNLLGEKVPRSIEIPSDVKVEVKDKVITVSAIDKEKAGQVAGSIEQLTRITHLDRRVIQDGIFITEKPHRRYV